MEETVLVLDVGKSRTKLNLVNPRGQIIDARGRPNQQSKHQGRLALDADGISDWLIPQLGELSQIAHISAIVPVGHGAAAALMFGDTLIAPVLDYETELPGEVSRRYDGLRGPFEETFSPRLPGGLNLGAQLFWQDGLFPEARDPGSQILLWPQYWAWWLSGERASEVTSLGCHTDMWRPLVREYSSLSLNQGWDKRLPALTLAGSVVGRLRSDIAGKTRLPDDCEILCGLHDSNAALHALRALNVGSELGLSIVSTGTWFVTMQAGAPTLPKLNSEFDTLANVNVDGKPVATARFMGGRDYEAITGSDVGVAATRDGVSKLIASGADRLFKYERSSGKYVLPWEAQWSGLDAVTKAALAALYLALNTDAALAHIDASGPILVEGRFSRDEAFLAALATLRSSANVYASVSSDGVALGAARLRWPELSTTSHPTLVEPLPETVEARRYT